MPKIRAALLALLTVIGLGLVAPAPASAAIATDCTRHVTTTGNDANAGTLAAPWRTVLASINKLSAGAVLCIHPGTYVQDVVDSSLPAGTSTARVTLKSYDTDNRALIDGSFRLTGLVWWQIRDLRFTNPTATVADNVGRRIVYLGNGHDNIFGPNNELFDSVYSGLLVGRSSPTSSTWPMRITVVGNYIHDTHAGIYFNPGAVSSGHLIERNLIVNSGSENIKVGWGDDCTGYSGGTAGYGAGGTTVRYNTLYNGGFAGNLVIAEPGGQHPVLAYRNLMVDPNSERGFHVRYDSATNTGVNTPYEHGCLGDNATVTDNWARGWKSGSTAQIPFSEDFDDAPLSQARESGNVVGQDPQLNAAYVPQNPAAQPYGHAAPVASTEPVAAPATSTCS